MERVLHIYREGGPGDHPGDDARRRNPGHQRPQARPGRPHPKAVDHYRGPRDVDDVDHQGIEHGHLAVPHGPEQRGPGVVDSDERVRRRRQQKVNQGGIHHLPGDVAKEQPQDVPPEQQRQPHQRQRRQQRHIQQLLGRRPGVPRLLPPQILGHHHRPAGG